jgi:FKBP-type peptidyl-prolyl cis-trans isomerase SlyD
MSDLVADGIVVLCQYSLKNSAGEVLDSSEEGDPLVYLQGASNIVPGLERAMLGKAVGDRVQVVVAPADGYGEKTGEAQKVERSNFPPEVELEAGMHFVVQQEDGEVVPVWIERVDEEAAYITSDHPLAGETLHFDVTVERLRAPTEDELTHGHPHGPDGTAGHHH